jgi:hypothetical protein
MKQRTFEPEPRRLVESNDRVAAVLRRAVADSENPTPNTVSRYWDELEPILNGKRPARIVPYGIAIASAISVVGCILGLVWRGSRDSEAQAVADVARALPSEQPLAVAFDAPIQIGERETRQLGDGTTIAVAAGGLVAVSHPTAKLTRFELRGGAAEFAVAPRKADEVLEVAAGRFRFRVVGTRFRVDSAKGGVSLAVTEGTVAVLENDQTIRIVSVGDSWSEKSDSARQQPEIQPSPGTSSKAAPAARRIEQKNEDCLEVARRGEYESAISCFAKQATGNGISAEVALYEMARIQHDALGQTERALETLSRYRERFPSGTLCTEATIKMIHICVEAGKDELALTESDQLLQSGQVASRRSELRFLRGRLYQRRGEFARAAIEYAEVVAASGVQAERANLERAGCLEQLGRAEEARSIYEILSRSRSKAVREPARKRLQGLERERGSKLERP